MKYLKFIFDFFNNGNAVYVVLCAFCAVSYIFAVTFTVCLCVTETRKKNKRFFIWLAAFAVLISVGSLVLDYFSAKSISLFYSVAVSFGLSGILMLEYFILCLQSKIAVKDKKSLAVPIDCNCHFGGCVQEKPNTDFAAQYLAETSLKPTIKAGIKEVPLRKTERVYMQSDNGEEILGERFLLDCIKKLQTKDLNEEDGLKLSRAEKAFSFPIKTATAEDKKRISDNAGSLITLLAKYK